MELLYRVVGACFVAFQLLRDYKMNAIALLTGAFSVIGLIGMFIARNPAFYLVAPIVSDLLWTLIFGVLY